MVTRLWWHRISWVATLILSLGVAASVLAAMFISTQNGKHLARELDLRTHQEMDAVLNRMSAFEDGIRGTRGAVLVGGQEHMTADAYRIYAESRDPKSEFPGVRSFGFIRRDGAHEILQYVSTDSDHVRTIGLDIASQLPLRVAAVLAMQTGRATMTGSLAPFFAEATRGTWCLVLLPVYRPHLLRDTADQRERATLGWAFAAVDLDAILSSFNRFDGVEVTITDLSESSAAMPLSRVGTLDSSPLLITTSPVIAELYGRRWAMTARADARFAASLHMTPPATVLGMGVLLSLLAGALAAVVASYWRRSAEIRSQQALLASVVASTSDAIILESLDGITLEWNPGAETLFGYRADEAIGRPLAALILPHDRAAENAALLAQCAAGSHVAPFDTVRCRQGGDGVDVSIAAAPVTGGGNRVVAIANTIRDITLQRAADQVLRVGLETLEREVERRTEDLAASERDLRAIIDALPSMIAYWDRDSVNRFSNRAYRRWYGFGDRPTVGLRLQECLGEHVLNRVRPHIETVLRGEAVSYEREDIDDDGNVTATLFVHYLPDNVDGDIRGFYVLMNDVTALKESQRRQAESEAFLEQAGAISGVGGFQIDLLSGRQTWTRQTFKIFEIESDAAPSTEDLDKLMDPAVGTRLWTAIRIASESGIGYDLELPVFTASRRPIWIRTIGVVEFETGRPARVVGAIQDITDRKEVAEALRITSERFALAADAAGIGVWEWDPSTDTLQWDEQMHRLYGHGEAAGPVRLDVWSAQVHVEDRSRCELTMQSALAGSGAGVDYEYRILLPSGETRHLRSAAKVQRDEYGRALRMVGIDFDETSRKVAETALIESEQKFRTLFELSPVGIALNDRKTGRFLHFNDALVTPTGHAAEELLNMTYWDITPSRFHDREKEQLLALDDSCRFGPYEKEYYRRDGTTYAVLLSGLKTTDPSGREVIWSIVQDISARKAMELQLAQAARCDKLTGLANRAQFMERLERSITRVNRQEQRYFAVLFLDFDRFKLINDTLGHDAGDELLRQISGRLRTTLRASDAMTVDDSGNVVSRFGGDEFLLLVNDLKTTQDAVRIAERLLNALAPPYDIQGNEVHSSASIGIITSDQCQTSAEEVVRNADVAMYEAKRAGRACSVVFDEAMHTRLARHVTIENNLRRAIGTSELYLVYQPIVDLSSRRVVSAEALIRWNHPTLGVISPSEFIPIAEESGLIVAVGQWVQNEACAVMADWLKMDPDLAPDTISVNVSRAELGLGQRLLTQINDTLARHKLPARRLQLEITEREIMRHPEEARALMVELRALGVKLAMDDFGTGTSSLGLLRHYPFDTIKIDRSFVQDVGGDSDVLAVIHATINLVENLGMTSLAEGVEDAGQVAILQSLGCRYAQGYYFSHPVSPDRFLDVLRQAAPEPAMMSERS